MLGGIEYVPLLCAKRAELKAFGRLTQPVRSSLFPIFALRPFPNARNLSHALNKIDQASEGFRYGLDLDWSRRSSTGLEPAAGEMRALFDPAGGYSAYFDVIAAQAERVPVLRDSGVGFDHIEMQQERAEALGRGLIIRLTRSRNLNLTAVLPLITMSAEDVVFIVDVGWSKDVLSQEMWASAVIRQITDWDATAEIIVASSSFPNSFSNINSIGANSIDERTLYDNLRRRHNEARLVYGDWASTRDYDEQMGGGGTIPNRIDVADQLAWTSYRADDVRFSYSDLASAAMLHTVWPSIPDCWGKGVVESTKMHIPGRIKNAEAAAAARINMHLTVQALGSGPAIADEEPYADKF